MPWTETSAVEQRIKFIEDLHRGLYSMNDLCDRYGIMGVGVLRSA